MKTCLQFLQKIYHIPTNPPLPPKYANRSAPLYAYSQRPLHSPLTDAVHPPMLHHQTSVTCSPNILIPSVTDSWIVTPNVCSVSVHLKGSPDHVDPNPQPVILSQHPSL